MYNSGALKQISGSTSKKQGMQSTVAGFNATDYRIRSNLSTTSPAPASGVTGASDNSPNSPPEAMPSTRNTIVPEDGIVPDSNNLSAAKLTSATESIPHTAALSSIVSVETKHCGNIGSLNANTAAV